MINTKINIKIIIIIMTATAFHADVFTNKRRNTD